MKVYTLAVTIDCRFVAYFDPEKYTGNFLYNIWPTAAMVYCYQNCSDLLWETIVLVIEKKDLEFEAEVQEFARILRSLEQFIQTVKGQKNV